MTEKGIDRDEAFDSVRLQRLINVCETNENTALYLLEEWNYEPQVGNKFSLKKKSKTKNPNKKKRKKNKTKRKNNRITSH